MSPLAQRIFRRGLDTSGGKSPAVMLMAQATCFDVSSVARLIEQTVVTLATTGSPGDPAYQHGGLLFGPDEVVWIEELREGKRCGAYVHHIEDQLCYSYFQGDSGPLVGLLQISPDGETFVIHLDIGVHPGRSEELHSMNSFIGGWIAASLMLINAPHGVKRTPGATVHKGLQRQARRAGLGALRPATVIELDPEAGLVPGMTGPSSGVRKAFHFCRSHLRMLHDGRRLRIRAHWRGDPALGVCQASYKVAA